MDSIIGTLICEKTIIACANDFFKAPRILNRLIDKKKGII